MNDLNLCEILNGTYDETTNCNNMPSVIFTGLLIVIGVTGNIIVLYVFTVFYAVSTYRVFVRTLAIVNLFICVTYLPLDILFQIDTLRTITKSEVLCKIYQCIVYGINYVSVSLVMLIGAERYRKMCDPHKKQLSTTMARIFALLVVVVSTLLSIPVLFTHGNHMIVVNSNSTRTLCGLDDDYSKTNINIVYFGLVGTIYILSTLFLIYVYISIIHTLSTRQKQSFRKQPVTRSVCIPGIFSIGQRYSVDSASSSVDKTIPTHKTRFRWSTIVITVILMLVYAPYIAICLVKAYNTSFKDNLNGFHWTLYQIGIRLHMISNVANPFIYGFTDIGFRMACRTIYRKKMIIDENVSDDVSERK